MDIFSKIRSEVRRIQLFFQTLKIHYRDFKYFYQNNNQYNCTDKSVMESQMLLYCHQLEKGLTHKNDSRIFGGEKAVRLAHFIESYLEKYEPNEITKLSINVIYEYLQSPNAVKDEKQRNSISIVVEKNKEVVRKGWSGIKELNVPPAFDESLINQFYQTRGSVRDFSGEPLSVEELEKVYKFVSWTPSACNRQSCRIHYYCDREKMNSIIDNQLGDQGWCHNATALFVITANTKYFNSHYERYQALIDGGMFAMNFVMGLHLQHIASCFKMYVRGFKRDKAFRAITGIPQEEIPVVVIMAGHYKEDVHISTKSVRFVQDIKVNA